MRSTALRKREANNALYLWILLCLSQESICDILTPAHEPIFSRGERRNEKTVFLFFKNLLAGSARLCCWSLARWITRHLGAFRTIGPEIPLAQAFPQTGPAQKNHATRGDPKRCVFVAFSCSTPLSMGAGGVCSAASALAIITRCSQRRIDQR